MTNISRVSFTGHKLSGLEMIRFFMKDLTGTKSFQGDAASCMYFIEEGEVRITIKQEVSCSSTYTISTYLIYQPI